MYSVNSSSLLGRTMAGGISYMYEIDYQIEILLLVTSENSASID